MIEELKSFGLTPNEATIYIFLLKHGQTTPPVIAKNTKIERSNTYHILQRLSSKSLITENIYGRRKMYSAKDPDSLNNILKEKQKLFEQILPNLKGLHNVQNNKPKITYYNGVSEIKKIYEKIYDCKEKSVLAIGSTANLASITDTFIEKEFIPKLKQKNIIIHDILSQNSEEYSTTTFKKELKGLYDYKIFPKNSNEFVTDILIWDDSIALLTLEDPIFGTLIQNATLVKTFKAIFTTLWKKL